MSEAVAALGERIRAGVGRAVAGQEAAIDQALVALLAGGHVLLEGVPGVAKTLLVRALAHVLDLGFKRIQFTPDLMPSDITGTNVFNPRDLSFHVRRGPVFANLVLADEINRTPPKTQAALLEAMEEGQVTIDGEAHPLPRPFVVFATQNPVEYEGTYPLPEAQLDRFLLKVTVPYPDAAGEVDVLRRHLAGFSPNDLTAAGLTPVAGTEALLAARAAVRQTRVEAGILDYIARLTRASRNWPSLALGASPRAGVALLQSSQAVAALAGREYVTPDDVKSIALPVLGHRVVVRPEAEVEGVTAVHAVLQVLESVPVPR